MGLAVLPSSTTTISSSGRLCDRALSIASLINRPCWWHRTTTLTRDVRGGWGGWGGWGEICPARCPAPGVWLNTPPNRQRSHADEAVAPWVPRCLHVRSAAILPQHRHTKTSLAVA